MIPRFSIRAASNLVARPGSLRGGAALLRPDGTLASPSGSAHITRESFDLDFESPAFDILSRQPKPRTNRCDVSFDDLEELVLLDAPVLLVDVRERRDVAREGKIPKSVNLPLSELKMALLDDCEDFARKYGFAKPEKHHDHLVFYSNHNVKSGSAVEIAHRLGFFKARHYSGGYEDWITRQASEASGDF